MIAFLLIVYTAIVIVLIKVGIVRARRDLAIRQSLPHRIREAVRPQLRN